MPVTVRSSTSGDAPAMSLVLTQIIEDWGSDRPSDPTHIRTFYIEHKDAIRTHVAIGDSDEIVGFQHLRLAKKDNAYGVAPGWGIIGTYVKLDAGRRGIGSSLFAATLSAARAAGLKKIDASIGRSNQSGLKYYGALGFKTYETSPNTVSKVFEVMD